MIQSELRRLIKIRTTGEEVNFELTDSVLDTLINDALRRVRQWYVEDFRFATLPLFSGGEDSQFFKESDFPGGKPAYIQDVWSAEPGDVSDLTGLALVSNLLGIGSHLLYYVGTGYEYGDAETQGSDIPGQSVYDDWFISYTNWVSLRPGIQNLMPFLEWEWDEDTGKIYVSGALDVNEVTVVFAPLPNTVDDVKHDKAIDWIQDFALASTKEVLARARGKFRGPGVNFETDSSEMLGEAIQEKADLIAKLKDLQFISAVSR